jgi:sulfate adenylyltransferase
VKGFYGKARAGIIKGFTGVDDPYEAPLNPEITLLTGTTTPQHNAELIMEYLIGQGFLLRDKAEIVKEEGEELRAAG